MAKLHLPPEGPITSSLVSPTERLNTLKTSLLCASWHALEQTWYTVGGCHFKWALPLLSRKPQSRPCRCVHLTSNMRFSLSSHWIVIVQFGESLCPRVVWTPVVGLATSISWESSSVSGNTSRVSVDVVGKASLSAVSLRSVEVTHYVCHQGHTVFETDTFVSSARNFNTTLNHMKKMMNN